MNKPTLFDDCAVTIEGDERLPAPSKGNLAVPLKHARPLILNWGGGVDSTAVAFKLREDGIMPDLVLFADTGGERRATYDWVQTFSRVMEYEWGWDVHRVQYHPSRAPYQTLLENCLINRTLPSLAFGYGKCSLKFKGDVMDAWIRGISRGPLKKKPWEPYVLSKARGSKPTKLIGYDNGPVDARRSIDVHECNDFFYRYPLREEWQMDREACVATIRKHGFEPPPKSSCHFCPAMKPVELEDLYDKEPELFLLGLYVEAYAKPGLEKIEGLWRNTRKGDGRPGSWVLWAEQLKLVKAEWEEVTEPFRPGEPPMTFKKIRRILFVGDHKRFRDAEGWAEAELARVFKLEAGTTA